MLLKKAAWPKTDSAQWARYSSNLSPWIHCSRLNPVVRAGPVLLGDYLRMEHANTRRFLTARSVMWIICGIVCILCSMQDLASKALIISAAVVESSAKATPQHNTNLHIVTLSGKL